MGCIVPIDYIDGLTRVENAYLDIFYYITFYETVLSHNSFNGEL